MSEQGEDQSQKTEDPTPKKLEDSRKKGQVALSREVNNWLMLFVSTILVAVFADDVLANLVQHLRTYIAQAHQMPSAPGGLRLALGESWQDVMLIMMWPLLLLMFTAFFGPFVQVGPLFAPEAIKPDISKISPIKGFGRLFSMKSLVEFAKGMLKLGVIAAVGTILMIPFYKNVEYLVGVEPILVVGELQDMIIRMMSGILLVLLVIAVADVTFQHYQHYEQMRMSKQEVKDEYKQTEGDPQVKQRLSQLRQQRAQERMAQSVPESDVVVTNPTHYAVALKYDPEEMDAPKVLAKGLDEMALRIRQIAEDNDIILYENPPLAQTLYDTVEVDDFIPPDLYRAVAEVISYVFKKTGKLNQ